ncbi:MAG: response regulator transcription factor [Pseudomonadota bacterium]
MTKCSSGYGNIAVVEDDENVSRVIERALTEHGYTAEAFHSANAFLDSLATRRPDLVVLDLGLPDIDGISLLSRLREIAANVPIVILSGRADDTDRIVGLELGADDYLGKPFNPRELIARVRSVLRRISTTPEIISSHGPACFAGFRYDPATFTITAPDGADTMLGTTEARLLEAFLHAPNRVLTRDQLLQQAARDDALDRAIDVSVSRLRKKLTTSGGNPIRTVYGAGYMFTARVEWAG